jgi:predicted lipid-binding transport protein (Tim44 family)
MRVILPAQSEAPVTASIPNDQRPAHRSSIAAQLLATLAGAIAAGLVGWLMIGFGSVRTIKSRRT